MTEPWYQDGLRFKCTRCGACCTGPPGYVWVTDKEIAAIAEFRGESVEETTSRYTRRVKNGDSLLEKAAGVSDPQQRNDLYAQAQKMIMDSAVWVPLHDQVNTIAYRANRTGYRWARTQWNVRMYEVTEAK